MSYPKRTGRKTHTHTQQQLRNAETRRTQRPVITYAIDLKYKTQHSLKRTCRSFLFCRHPFSILCAPWLYIHSACNEWRFAYIFLLWIKCVITKIFFRTRLVPNLCFLTKCACILGCVLAMHIWLNVFTQNSLCIEWKSDSRKITEHREHISSATLPKSMKNGPCICLTFVDLPTVYRYFVPIIYCGRLLLPLFPYFM